MDLSSALKPLENILGEFGALPVVAENGFEFLDGKSGILVLFAEFIEGAVDSSGIDYHLADFSALAVFIQISDWIILILSVLMCMFAVLWFFFVKREELIKIIAMVAIWIAIVYLLTGILFASLLNKEWENLLDSIAGSGAVFFDSMFFTYSFIPTILIAVLEIGFWCIFYKVGVGSRAIDIGEILKENDEMILIPFEHLKKLKELFDAGILTEEEFIEEKAKLLNK